MRVQDTGDRGQKNENKVKSYKDLIVWQKSMDLVIEIYKLVKKLPKEETYSLSDQMRRAVVSIPSNIAEGYTRKSTNEYLNFLSIANGSRTELETQLLICERIKYLSEADTEKAFVLIDEIGAIIYHIMTKLRK